MTYFCVIANATNGCNPYLCVVRMSPGKGAILSVVVLPSCRTDLLEVQRRIYVAKYNIGDEDKLDIIREVD